ncbi:ATP-binding protein [Bifidobacterium aquikefiri]|uniref:ATP-binding protein n=1 Tax=Bifidobacterium aquikefiri TaxID=1653207 RepID=UPI0039EA08CE
MLERPLKNKLVSMLKVFPIVSLTGPRQSGKSTLLRNSFPEYSYVSLEDPDLRQLAENDPRSFLKQFNSKAIFDEIQRTPELFSYIQGVVDEQNEPGQYLLSGSQNFLLLKGISQSLAGRVSIQHLLPLSYAELANTAFVPHDLDDFMFLGGYPRLVVNDIAPSDFFPSYMRTYLERDVREELGVKKIDSFTHFITACALRTGEVLNVENLANECDISVKTARDWISILHASFIIFLLQPFHKNYGRRLTKSPKMYFYDTGLACNLIGIEQKNDVLTHHKRGNLFENAVVVEIIKQYYSLGKRPQLYFWRDSNQNEIDLVIEKGGKAQYAIEIKSTATFNPNAFSTLNKLGPIMGLDRCQRIVAYGGTQSYETKQGQVLGLPDLNRLVI